MDEPGQENIRKKRIPFNSEVEIGGGECLHASEISIGGIYLKTKESYPVGTLLNLQFKLNKTDEMPISVQGCVLYNHKQIGLGLGFLNLTEENRKRIEEFIAKA